MIQQPSEFEVMRVLHSLYVKGLISWDEVVEMLVSSIQLELTYLNQSIFEAQSLDGLITYRLE